jgi:holin-like protein
MNPSPLQGLAWLLVFQAAGEVLARALGLPFPGPVVGMLLLLGGLAVPAVRAPVQACADFLLAHLSLLFVPVGVGVLAHLDVLASFGGRLVVVIVLSTWAGMVATFWTLGRLTTAGDWPREASPADREAP